MAIKNILGNPNVRNYIAATKQPVNVMNTNKRGSASIVIDTSGSMNPYRDLLKRLICEFYDDVLKDPIASNILELSIITFNSDVFILQDVYKRQQRTGSTKKSARATKPGTHGGPSTAFPTSIGTWSSMLHHSSMSI